MLKNRSGTIMLALFERRAEPCGSTVAFRVGAEAFLAWKDHLTRVLDRPPTLSDHDVAWSLYFADPDGNPFEITSYDHATLAPVLT